ncbi:MAG: hypothetical protein ACI8PZ_005006 [Myxococcota bacterium]|jgi:hypothetical protein
MNDPRRLAAVLLLAAGCSTGGPSEPTDTDTDGDTDAGLTWFTTCGDPVCGGYAGPFDGVVECVDEAPGDACDDDADRCDPVDDCNALLVCAASDPKDAPGGCPISQAAVKRDITYLAPEALASAADQALALKLATWRYRWEPAGGQSHLGFIIDDAPESPAVRVDGERVDLYGYTSLALAAVQVQQTELDALRAELAALRAEVEGCRAE